ncbi:hypothetical protein F5X97DRAFT_343691 [Nemania serpens]|nr:hypothetical protein F5X97DRAFT_343691 [Nemania serpens]
MSAPGHANPVCTSFVVIRSDVSGRLIYSAIPSFVSNRDEALAAISHLKPDTQVEWLAVGNIMSGSLRSTAQGRTLQNTRQIEMARQEIGNWERQVWHREAESIANAARTRHRRQIRPNAQLVRLLEERPRMNMMIDMVLFGERVVLPLRNEPRQSAQPQQPSNDPPRQLTPINAAPQQPSNNPPPQSTPQAEPRQPTNSPSRRFSPIIARPTNNPPPQPTPQAEPQEPADDPPSQSTPQAEPQQPTNRPPHRFTPIVAVPQRPTNNPPPQSTPQAEPQQPTNNPLPQSTPANASPERK